MKASEVNLAEIGRRRKYKRWNESDLPALKYNQPKPKPLATVAAKRLDEVVPSNVVMASAVKVTVTHGLVPWLREIVKQDPIVAALMVSRTRKSASQHSPHKRRMAQFAKKPELMTSFIAEHIVQVRLFYRLEVDYPQYYPDIYAIPNGGKRSIKVASEMSYEGQKRG